MDANNDGPLDHSARPATGFGWWSALLAAANLNRMDDPADNASIDDVLAVVDQLPTMLDHDGKISAEEYHRLVEAWNGVETDTEAVFPLLGLNHDGHVSRTEFTLLWTQFWVGDDPAEPGTWVFERLRQPA